MNTVTQMGPYRDLLFYTFVAGVVYLLINIHNLIRHEKLKRGAVK